MDGLGSGRVVVGKGRILWDGYAGLGEAEYKKRGYLCRIVFIQNSNKIIFFLDFIFFVCSFFHRAFLQRRTFLIKI